MADLSAGFWGSLLTKSYDIPFSGHYNLARIFPNLPRPDRAAIAAQCAGLLKLRNRVAHHEPVFHLDLPVLRQDLAALTAGMCSSVAAYVGVACTFEAVWRKHP
jgi:hypothetical protein